MNLKHTIDTLMQYHKTIIEAATAYASGVSLTVWGYLAHMDWQQALAMLGGFILFCARASVDIPKAYDYWVERRKKTDDKSK